MTGNAPYAGRYSEVAVKTANPLQLVVMLYHGAVRNLHQAKSYLEQGNIEGRTHAINRTLAIISELQASLNFEEGGQVARSLESLYAYMKQRLVAANLGQESGPLTEVISLLTTLQSAWEELVSQELRQSAALILPKQDGVHTLKGSPEDSFRPGTINVSC
jgi:flagellar secretion chaperone FliS